MWEHHVEVRLAPRQNADQQVLDVELAIDPPCAPRSYDDCFGNHVHYCALIAPHDHFALRLRAEVVTSLDNPFAFSTVPPAGEREWIAERLRLQPRLWDYLLHRSPVTPDLHALAISDLAIPVREADQPLLDAVLAALEWIGDVLTYEPGFTPAPPPLAEVLTRRVGGSQDLAHLLISIVRGWGFAARYVMGYRDPGYVEDEGGVQRLHAWAEILVPGAGWRGVDPTTRLVANQTYIAVAVGRDASDAVPIKAVFQGGEEPEEAGMEAVVEVSGDQ